MLSTQQQCTATGSLKPQLSQEASSSGRKLEENEGRAVGSAFPSASPAHCVKGRAALKCAVECGSHFLPFTAPPQGQPESLGARGDECMYLHFYVIDISEYRRHSPTGSHSAHYLTVFLRYFWFQSLKSCCVSVNSCLAPPVWTPQGPGSQSLCGRCFHSLQGCSSLLGAAVLGHHYSSEKPPPHKRGSSRAA